MSRFFKLDQAERVSLMFGLGMNNNGTGLVLASLALSSYPNIMVPIIFYNLVQHPAGIVQEIMSRRSNDLDA
jgi:BASS family bile acid:Na+ symporter